MRDVDGADTDVDYESCCSEKAPWTGVPPCMPDCENVLVSGQIVSGELVPSKI